jgi:hypothetical protein
MLDEGTMFVFGSWVCVADSVDSFRRHLIDNANPEAPAATPHRDLDKFIDNLAEMLLPDGTSRSCPFFMLLRLVLHHDSSDQI